jgi:hypothetical protein
MHRGTVPAGLCGAVFVFSALQSGAQTPPSSKGSLPDPAAPTQPWPPPSAPPPPPPAPPATAPPAPAPTTTAPPPTGAAPTQPPPPPGASPYPYAYPPPYPGYPPPGAYYPPPGAYYPPQPYGAVPYPYGYEQPPKPKPQYPEDAAAQTSPFIDLLAGGIALDQRYDQFLAVGGQAGLYLGARVRLAIRGLMLSDKSGDDVDAYPLLSSGYSPVESDKANFIYGASLGAAPVVRPNFLFAPGVSFMRSDVSDYGSFVGLSVPFEWVGDEGMRIGFEVVLGRAFGGSVHSRCTYSSTKCTLGDERDEDRPAGTGFYAAFQIGWGFNHPPPKTAESRRNSEGRAIASQKR